MLKAFVIGAVGYPALELLYRGRTHFSMALAGGGGMCLIRHISRQKWTLTSKMLYCGMGITAIEFACGMIWNRNHQVWDYRNMPVNIAGQICLPFTLLWCGLSGIILQILAAQEERPGI